LEIDAAADEPSIETGLTAYQVTRVRNSPGALGTVMNNLAALGVGRLLPVTVIGEDGHGYDLRRELENLPVDPQHIVCDPRRLTPTYTKPLRPDGAGAWRELNRLDVRTRGPLEGSAEKELLRRLDDAFEVAGGLIVLDQINEQDWGVVNTRVRDHLEQLAARNPEKLVYVDSRRRLGEFSFGVLKGNRAELLSAAGNEDVQCAAEKLAARTGRPVFATLAEEGMLVMRPGDVCERIPAIPVAGPIDIVTMLISLIRMFRLGPLVSLNGSPTVSPTTAALWASVPLPPWAAASMYFLALSHEPPALAMKTATQKPVVSVPTSSPSTPPTPEQQPDDDRQWPAQHRRQDHFPLSRLGADRHRAGIVRRSVPSMMPGFSRNCRRTSSTMPLAARPTAFIVMAQKTNTAMAPRNTPTSTLGFITAS
jgi:hypothetical protein